MLELVSFTWSSHIKRRLSTIYRHVLKNMYDLAPVSQSFLTFPDILRFSYLLTKEKLKILS